MTPEEYLEKADKILETRRLQTHQYWDLIHTVEQVQKRGRSLPTDDFYLEIVGVPMKFGFFPPSWHWGRPRGPKSKQGSLF